MPRGHTLPRLVSPHSVIRVWCWVSPVLLFMWFSRLQRQLCEGGTLAGSERGSYFGWLPW